MPVRFLFHIGRGITLETEAREGGILEEMRLDNSMCNPQVRIGESFCLDEGSRMCMRAYTSAGE